jgi:hypothetical protein
MQGTKLLSVVFSMIIFTGITASSNAFAESDEQNTLDAITNIEFRSVTDFHTYLPDSQISFNVNCNQLAGEFAIGFNTIIQKSDGSPADVNDVRNLVFLQRGSSNLGAIIDAVNTGSDRLELTTVVSCAKLLPASLPTASPSSTSTGKTSVCHNDKITLYLPSQAVGAHENHGDTLGGCSENTISPSNPTSTYPVTFSLPTSTGKTIICHNDKIILYLPSQAVGAHENHGDTLGECSENTISPSNPTSTTSSVSFSHPTSTPGPIEKTAVCHNDKVTLHLPSQAVRAHENHGDILGECLDNISTSQEKSKQQAKKLQLEADKAQREADRLIEQQAKKLQLEADKAKADRLAKQEADKAQREADRLIEQQAKKLQLEADKAKADRLAKQEADKAQREADRLIEQQAKKLQLEADKAQKESIVEAKNNQNNSKKDNKESKLPTPGPK